MYVCGLDVTPRSNKLLAAPICVPPKDTAMRGTADHEHNMLEQFPTQPSPAPFTTWHADRVDCLHTSVAFCCYMLLYELALKQCALARNIFLAQDLGGILLHPFAGRGIMLGPVLQVDLGNLWHQRIIGVRICQKRRDGEQDLGDRQSWAPLILQDV